MSIIRPLSIVRWMWFKLPVMISLSLLAVAVMVKQADFFFMRELQLKVFDVYQQQFPREYEPAGVKIIDIDDESLARLGQWPWPRQVVAELIYRLIAHNAAVIAFDIVFAEPDRTSPTSMAELWQDHPQLSKMLRTLPDHDTLLAKSFENGYIVTGFVLNHERTERLPTVSYGFPPVNGPSEVDDLNAHLLEAIEGDYSGAVVNLPQLEEAAEGNGFFNNIPDQDGIIRRIPLILDGGGKVYFSLAMEALRVAQGASGYLVKMAGASGEASIGIQSGITHVRNGHFEIPTDAKGRMMLHYTPMKDERYVSAWEVLSEDFDASQIEGHIVFIGTSAPGLLDLRATPLNPSLPGVEVHAQAVEQILLGQHLHRPDWMAGAENVLTICSGLLLLLIMSRLTAAWGAVFMVSAQVAAIGGSAYAYVEHGYLIEPVFPSLVILTLYLSESLRRYMLSESERKQVRGAFSQYMSPALVEELAKNPAKLTLGGEMRDMTMLFADIRGFTTISEQFDAQGLTEFINAFLTPMTEVILKRDGTIDKYMGDCIMAFWNAPLSVRDHPKQACLSALEMFDAVAAMNRERKQLAAEQGTVYLPIAIGAGVNTGEVCVGNMGSDQRFDYSVLGDAVNLASRLEGQSKTYGVGVVIGPQTHAAIPELATLELDLIKVKGKTEAVRIFGLIGGESLADDERFAKLKQLWQQALEAYRAQEWDGAENFIHLCETAIEPLEAELTNHSLPVLFQLYRERIRAYRLTPPGEAWDGVFEATSK